MKLVTDRKKLKVGEIYIIFQLRMDSGHGYSLMRVLGDSRITVFSGELVGKYDGPNTHRHRYIKAEYDHPLAILGKNMLIFKLSKAEFLEHIVLEII